MTYKELRALSSPLTLADAPRTSPGLRETSLDGACRPQAQKWKKRGQWKTWPSSI